MARQWSFGKQIVLFGCVLMLWLAVGVSPVSANSISTTTLVTAGTDNKGANGSLAAYGAKKTISSDGNLVVFSSRASNLVPGDTNGTYDIFVYNRTTHKTELISKDLNGQPANNWSLLPSMSADGRYVAYITIASNAIEGFKCPSGDPQCANILVYDRTAKTRLLANRNTQGARVGVSLEESDGPIAPVISANGQFVAFRSISKIISPAHDHNNAADTVVRDLKANVTRLASVDNNGNTGTERSNAHSISGDGRYVVFSTYSALVAEDTNNLEDVYIHDMQTGVTRLVSVAKDGGPIRDLETTTDRPEISRDGRYVVFQSSANDIVTGDDNQRLDIFLRDMQSGITRRVSLSTKGVGGNDGSFEPSLSDDGRYIVFSSFASNLVPGDTNEDIDVFVYYRDYGLTRRVSVASHSVLGGNGRNFHPAISGNGKVVTFSSNASNLRPAPVTGGITNLYLFYNPVVDIPYYDNVDFMDLPWL